MKFQKIHIKFQKNGGKTLEFQKKSYEIPNSEGKKLEFVDFSLIGPVSNPFTN